MGWATGALRPPVGALPEVATRRGFLIHAYSAAQRLASEHHGQGSASAIVGRAGFHHLLTRRYPAGNRIVRWLHESSSTPLLRMREEEEAMSMIEQLLMLLWGATPTKRRAPRVMLER
ncbi:MAG TPA: hypothetical protein VF752_08960 [Thermoleophilaceae bacterium]